MNGEKHFQFYTSNLAQHGFFVDEQGWLSSFGCADSGQGGNHPNFVKSAIEKTACKFYFGVPGWCGQTGKKVKKCSMGVDHSMILTVGGKVFCLGSNEYGQIGVGKEEFGEDKGNRTMDVLEVEFFNTRNKSVEDVVCGGFHTLFLCDDGEIELFGVGNNEFGQLGLGDQLDRFEVTAVQPGNKIVADIVSMKCGFNHSIMLKKNGQVVGMGLNNKFQLGLSDDKYSNFALTPVLIQFKDWVTIKQFDCGPDHSLFLTKDGKVYLSGEYLVLSGKGKIHYGRHAINAQVQIPEKESIQFVKCGGKASYIITDQSFYCFGNNNVGQLGLGEFANKHYADLIDRCDIVTANGKHFREHPFNELVQFESGFQQMYLIYPKKQIRDVYKDSVFGEDEEDKSHKVNMYACGNDRFYALMLQSIHQGMRVKSGWSDQAFRDFEKTFIDNVWRLTKASKVAFNVNEERKRKRPSFFEPVYGNYQNQDQLPPKRINLSSKEDIVKDGDVRMLDKEKKEKIFSFGDFESTRTLGCDDQMEVASDGVPDYASGEETDEERAGEVEDDTDDERLVDVDKVENWWK